MKKSRFINPKDAAIKYYNLGFRDCWEAAKLAIENGDFKERVEDTDLFLDVFHELEFGY